MKLKSLFALLALSLYATSSFAWIIDGIEINQSSVFVLYKDYGAQNNDVVCDIQVSIHNTKKALTKAGKPAKCSDFSAAGVSAMIAKSNSKALINLFNELKKTNPKFFNHSEYASDSNSLYCNVRPDVTAESPLKDFCALADRESFEGNEK